MDEFAALGIGEALARAMEALGYEKPTRVQELSVPRLVAGENLVIRSDTGTGKTLAYLSAIFARKAGSRSRRISCVVAPTQELAVQISREAARLAEAAKARAAIVLAIGGSLLSRQAKAIRAGADLVVGTCARILDLQATGVLSVDRCDAVVFDEIDRLLAKETRDATERLVSMVPDDALVAFVSATVDERTGAWISERRKGVSRCDPGSEGVLSETIEHWAFYSEGRKKNGFLRSFLAALRPARCLVFFSRADKAADAAEKLEHHGVKVAALHARASQDERKKAIESFKAGKVDVLVTSDLAARGLDIQGITHVVSADLPDDADVYVHRAGRTGRAGVPGFSVIAADLVELSRASRIAVKKGFSFHCMELSGGEPRDVEPEAFFAGAEASDTERRMHEREKRNDPGIASRGMRDRNAHDFERPRRADERPPRAEGRPPRAEGRPRRADERPRRAEGRPRRADERPPRAEGRPRRADERPRRAEGRPRRADERPPRAEGRPRRADERPRRADDAAKRIRKPGSPGGTAKKK